MKSEFELIECLKKILPKPPKGDLGIGDDAALVNISAGKQLVVSGDVIVDGVDFNSAKAGAGKIGRKALAVNLSDMAAMGARPKGYFVNLGLPVKTKARWVKAFYEGMKPLSGKYKCPCYGGDLSSSKNLFAAITIVGEVSAAEVLRRDRCRPGDFFAVTGSLGGSILGRHFNFEPRVREGRWLASKAYVRAAIDLSDGLLSDLGHLLKASCVGADLWMDKIPVSKDALKIAGGRRPKALKHAMSDGEDFELLFAVPGGKRKTFEAGWKKAFPRVKLSWIGKARKKPAGIACFDKGKKVKTPGFSGFDHFRM